REVDAVMVGAGTVLADDPRLTVRAVDGVRSPARVVIDSSGRIPAEAAVLDVREAPTIVATTARAPHELQLAWKEAGAEVIALPEGEGGVDLRELLAHLGGRGMLEVLCEGGPRLATALLRDDLVDRLELHYGAGLIGEGGLSLGDLAVTTMSEVHRWRCPDVRTSDGDIVAVLERTGR
ncbi:MAG: RibD family protein, partial [Actinomycetota bacterium]